MCKLCTYLKSIVSHKAIRVTEKQNRKLSMYLGTLTISLGFTGMSPGTKWNLYQQNLHSKTDHASALELILAVCPELRQYMTDYQLVLTGDYPTWKYNKKLVAEVIIIYFHKYIL